MGRCIMNSSVVQGTLSFKDIRPLIHCNFTQDLLYPYSNVLSTKTYHVIYFLKWDADTKRIVVRDSTTTSHSIRPMNHMYSSVHPINGEYMPDSGRW
jgi:hypothetical protein